MPKMQVAFPQGITATPEQLEDRSALRNFLRHGARVTRAAHSLLADVVQPGDFVVDATCGNGSDTLWLCRAVGPGGRVLAFDVQASRLQHSRDSGQHTLSISCDAQQLEGPLPATRCKL